MPKEFPCFLCSELREIRRSIKDKPYFICDECGVQAFIRKKEGMERLESVGQALQVAALNMKEKTKVLQWMELIRTLDREIKRLEALDGFKEVFVPDKSREVQKAALRKEKGKVEARMRRFVQRKEKAA